MYYHPMKPVLTFLLALCFTAAFAQPGHPPSGKDREQVERLRIAFLTDELDLSVEEGQQFWPIYNTFSDTRDAKEKTIRKTMRALEDETATEKQVLEAMATVTQLRTEIAELEQTYITDVMAILGPEKAVKLIHAEKRFKKVLIDKLQERRQGPPRRNQP